MRNRIAVAVAVAVSILLGAVVVAPTLTGDVLAGIGALGFFGSFALMFWSRFRWRIAGSVLGAGVALMVAGNAIVPADVREARAEERDAREAERAERDREAREQERLAEAERWANRDPRVHRETSFPDAVDRFLQPEAVSDMTLGVIAYHNDLHVTVNRDTSAIIDGAGCDEQREFAATLWQRWIASVPESASTGTGVTVKSYTGRTLASAAEGIAGARFHCE